MMDIKHFFGLTKEPFSQNIKLDDLYILPGLKPLIQRFEYAVKIGAISLITGEVGSGKSTSLRLACSKLHPSRYRIIPLVGTPGSMIELLRQFLLNFGEEIRTFQSSLIMKKVRDIVLDIASRKQVPVLVIDEAHLLKKEVFDQLHTLCQFDFDSNPIMPMILCGQDQLIDKLITLSAKPLASRIVGRSHMDSLQLKDMKGYIEHHLQLAGVEKSLFAEEAILAIHQTSGGLLRRANIIARGAMMAAAMEKSQIISGEHIRLAGTEIL
jgi:general secretion pathway protein A